MLIKSLTSSLNPIEDVVEIYGEKEKYLLVGYSIFLMEFCVKLLKVILLYATIIITMIFAAGVDSFESLDNFLMAFSGLIILIIINIIVFRQDDMNKYFPNF